MADWFDEGGSGAQLDLRDVLDSGALDAVVLVVEHGALVSLGLTSDGGALGCTVTSDGRWRREYFRDGAALTTWLGSAAAALGGSRSSPASSAPRGRSRGARGRS